MPQMGHLSARVSSSVRILMASWILILMATITPAALAGPNPADRMQLYRNANRGVSYLELGTTGAASSTAPIAMKAVELSTSTATRCSTCAANVYPIDFAGNGHYGFVHFNGYRFMRVYDTRGRKLWQIDNPAGRVHRDPVHRDTLAVLDADGDGGQDIVHCWAEAGRKMLMIHRGRDGAVLRKVALDGKPGDECQIAAFRVAGRNTPLILVALQNTSGCPKAGNWVDTWGRTWRSMSASSRSGTATPALPGTMPTRSTRMPTASPRKSSSAAISTARAVPGSVRSISATPMPTAFRSPISIPASPASRRSWSVPPGSRRSTSRTTAHPCGASRPARSMIRSISALARLDPASPTPTIAVTEKDTDTLYYINSKGRILFRLPGHALSVTLPLQNANLDGKTGSDDLLIEFARVFDLSGKVRLGTDWYWNLKGTKLTQVKPPSTFDSWVLYPFAMDLDHDGRDEIITWSQSLIVVGKAQ